MRLTRCRSTRLLALAVGLVMTLALGSAARASDEIPLDVACDANTFVFQGPTSSAGPDYGASFVVQGVIYPGGTFAANGPSSGLLADGTPEFPDLVVGRWTCQGHFIGDGIATASGPFVVTMQLYDLDLDEPGADTLVSQGLELIDLNVPIRRAVTGGTGAFNAAGGDVTQTSIGINATGLFNFTFLFDLDVRSPRGPRPPSSAH